MTLEQIADLLGVTRERVRQIEATAMRKLKRSALLFSGTRLEPSTLR